MARMRAMYARGGDNPYAVNYDADQKKNIDSVNDDSTLVVDNATAPSEDSFMSKAKSFSF